MPSVHSLSLSHQFLARRGTNPPDCVCAGKREARHVTLRARRKRHFRALREKAEVTAAECGAGARPGFEISQSRSCVPCPAKLWPTVRGLRGPRSAVRCG